MKSKGNLTYTHRRLRKLVFSSMWCHVLWRRTQQIYLKRHYTYTSLLDVTFRKTSVTIYQSTRCDILEDMNIHKDNGEHIRSRNTFRVRWQYQYVLQNGVNVQAVVCVRVCVCMYVCTYVRTYACSIYVCMYICTHVCMYVCMHACMHVCKYVHMYFWIITNLMHSFSMCLFHASTCFEQQVLIIRRTKLYQYTIW